MKTSSPRQMAIMISLIASAISGITQTVLDYPLTKSHILPMIFSLLFIFIITYIIVYFLLNSFIFEKINPIYKTIHNFNIPEKELRKDLEEKDVIKEVNTEVIDWANKKTKEIAQLKQLAKYRKEFLGNVSHELKTPIFNIQGYILTLLDGGIDDPQINTKYLEKTEKSINRMISIVEDLESIARLESGFFNLQYAHFNIVKLFEEIFENQELRAKEKGIQLKFKNPTEKPVYVHADREQIDHLITNLIVNSINYGVDYGYTEVSFLDMNENILIEVTDNGLGIPEQDIPRIFERFYRVDKSRSRNAGGTGLGLAIVKHIIEAHNQTINVRSSLKNGTSFAFTLKKGKKK
jgi:two-component system phosphate regulon sensor histidine kinase PhoR